MGGRDRMKRLAVEELVSWVAGIVIFLILLLAPAPHGDQGTHEAPSEQGGER